MYETATIQFTSPSSGYDFLAFFLCLTQHAELRFNARMISSISKSCPGTGNDSSLASSGSKRLTAAERGVMN